MSYADRAGQCRHQLARQIFTIMDQKKTNLAFAADVTTCRELLDVRTVVQSRYVLCRRSHGLGTYSTVDRTVSVRALPSVARSRYVLRRRRSHGLGTYSIARSRYMLCRRSHGLGTYSVVDRTVLVRSLPSSSARSRYVLRRRRSHGLGTYSVIDRTVSVRTPPSSIARSRYVLWRRRSHGLATYSAVVDRTVSVRTPPPSITQFHYIRQHSGR